MSMRYKGAVLSATAPVTSSSSAVGIWTMRQQLQAVGGTGWPVPPPTVIGQAYGGGYYAGKISTTANGVATHYLIVAPKATGEATGKKWGVYGDDTGVRSKINGPTNTTTLAALGAAYEAAVFCNNLNSGSGLNSYTDWYLPALNELEVLYYFLKPSTTSNQTISGSNVNAVSPEPYDTNYTTGSPAQTTATGTNGFRDGEMNAFVLGYYWPSTEFNANNAWRSNFDTGYQYDTGGKTVSINVRAVRRVPV